jgi:hypothetical protein
MGIDYSKLRDLLAAGEWKEAERETAALLLKISGREQEGQLTTEDIEKFPCPDLRTIDQLWVKYSKGRFGFSVQQPIWENSGGRQDADLETCHHFGDSRWDSFASRVGWRVNGNWLSWFDLTFTLNAPEGHLPLGLGQGLIDSGSAFFSRVEACGVQSTNAHG